MVERVAGALVHRKEISAQRWFLGDPFEILIAGEDTGGAYALTEWQFAPGSGSPPHVHEREDEFFYVIEGGLEFQVCDRVVVVNAGEFIHAYRGERHCFRNPLASPARVLIGMTPATFLGFFLALSTPRSESPEAPAFPPVEEVVAVAARYGCKIGPLPA